MVPAIECCLWAAWHWQVTREREREREREGGGGGGGGGGVGALRWGDESPVCSSAVNSLRRAEGGWVALLFECCVRLLQAADLCVWFFSLSFSLSLSLSLSQSVSHTCPYVLVQRWYYTVQVNITRAKVCMLRRWMKGGGGGNREELEPSLQCAFVKVSVLPNLCPSCSLSDAVHEL